MLTWNKVCQKTGWNEKDHKVNCKLLKDSDLRELFVLEGKHVQ